MNSRIQNIFIFATRLTDQIERLLLGVLVTGMVILSALQILLRNIWHSGLNWAEPLLGMALLWLTMLGALAATGLGRHLSIDLAAALLPHRWTTWLGRITSVFAAVVCILLAWAAGRYVGFQRDMEMTMLLGWPVWKYYLIIPVVFWLMAARFLVRVIVPANWSAPETSAGLPGEGRTPS